MPFLDVASVLLDPDLADTFTVLRRTQTISTGGIASTSPILTLPAIGVVAAATPDDLIRGDATQLMSKSITVDTIFALQGPAPGYQPDVVVWHGDNYVVTHIDDYSNFGAGFVHALCQSIDSIDQGPQPSSIYV